MEDVLLWPSKWPTHIKSISSVGRYRGPRHKEIHPIKTLERTQVIELITSGEVYFEENGRERLFGCGGIFWHLPGEYTVHKSVPDNPYECITIMFNVDPSYDPWAETRIPRASRWEDPLTVKKFATDILAYFHGGEVGREQLCLYIYSRLNWQIFQYHHRLTEQNLPVPLRGVLEYIDDNLEKSLSLDTLSAYSQLSTSHLHALFKKHLNQTPHRLINDRRLRQARNLLAGSDLRIGEICNRCGFINGETFNRCFKKSEGMTPSEFRLSQRPVG